jgi:hypothetical protein
MNLFTAPDVDVISSYSFTGPAVSRTGVSKVSRGGGQRPELMLSPDRGSPVDLSTQFIIFQLNNKMDGRSVLESSAVEPNIDGSGDQPDLLVSLEMLSFQLGAQENIDPDTRATMRINFGKDESSTDQRFDTAFWSIAAGLRLYDQVKNKKTDGKDLKSNLHKAFGNRPVEIPGGLGKLSFEVVKHKEPPWWKQIFGFLQSGTGEALVSVLGFPAITTQAIKVLDELLARLTDSRPEPLFKSLPMRLALSKYARDAFTGGSERVKIGCLRPGFCIMARGKDFKTIAEADVIYYPTYGKLVPRDLNESELVSGSYQDPLRDVTYVVFRLGMKSTKLDPTFSFSA